MREEPDVMLSRREFKQKKKMREREHDLFELNNSLNNLNIGFKQNNNQSQHVEPVFSNIQCDNMKHDILMKRQEAMKRKSSNLKSTWDSMNNFITIHTNKVKEFENTIELSNACGHKYDADAMMQKLDESEANLQSFFDQADNFRKIYNKSV